MNRLAIRRTIPVARAAESLVSAGKGRTCLARRNVATSTVTAELDRSATESVVDPREPVSHVRQDVVNSRKQAIRNAKPFSEFLTDKFNRQHDYLRISLTERCNLRCLYCMPEEGVQLSPSEHILTSPEIYYISSLFVSQGVTKIRLTGGEPTVRKDIIPLMQSIGSLRPKGLRELAITTNGISLHRKLDSMVESGLTGVNLSLDTLDPFQFQLMTRRKGFEAVMKSMDRILETNKAGAGIKLKVNCVVMRGLNAREIIPFVELGKHKDIEVRFIEYMPFDGNKWSQNKMISYKEMLEIIKTKYPELRKVPDHKNNTSKTYEVPGFAGKVGFITSMTHNFCGSCNRLRITSDGNLKVCLFGNTEVSLRDILRKSNNGEPIDEEAFARIVKAGVEYHNDSSAGREDFAWHECEQELLEVIGAAVKRKKAKHAGMGQLENMKNRPMILIDEATLIQTNYNNLTTTPIRFTRPWSLPTTGNSKLRNFPLALFNSYHPHLSTLNRRLLSTSPPVPPPPSPSQPNPTTSPAAPRLTHLTPSGSAHMVSITSKPATHRTAIAVGHVAFSRRSTLTLVRAQALKKGDVLAVARVAGIMAAKRTPELVPLCHPIALSHVGVELFPVSPPPGREGGEGEEGSDGGMGGGGGGELEFGGVQVEARVTCTGQTGVEMEALTAAMGACLTVFDMCKAVDKGMSIDGVRVVLKEGGRSGVWKEDGWKSLAEEVQEESGEPVE